MDRERPETCLRLLAEAELRQATRHATRVVRRHEGDDTTRLKVVPPLSRASSWIEVLTAGQSAEVRATLSLSWQ